MEDNYFVDVGVFYANQDMVQKNIVLSINTGLVYDIEDARNVKIIKKVSDAFSILQKRTLQMTDPAFMVELLFIGKFRVRV